MSERVCQFFLRGRCTRSNCEFKHTSSRDYNTSGKDNSTKALCRFYQAKGSCRFGSSCKFRHSMDKPQTVNKIPPPLLKQPPPPSISKGVNDSDDESVLKKGNESDEESNISGFTELPQSSQNNKSSVPENSNKETKTLSDKKNPDESKIKEKSPVKEDPVQESELHKIPEKEPNITEKGSQEPIHQPVQDSIDPEIPSEQHIESNASKQNGNSTPSPEEKSNGEATSTNQSSFAKPGDPVNQNATTTPLRKSSRSKSKAEEAQNNTNKSEIEKKKNIVADLSREWDDDEEQQQQDNGQIVKNESILTAIKNPENKLKGSPKKKEEQPDLQDEAESIEDIENFIQDEEASHASASRNSHMSEKEDWVTLIFGEDGKEIQSENQEPITEDQSVYDLNPDEVDAEESNKNFGKRQRVSDGDGLRKKDGVTKIGNNMYFYTGNKGEESQDDEGGFYDDEDEGELQDTEEDCEKWDENMKTDSTEPKKRRRSKHKPHRTDYVYGARSSAAKTRRCGECENCNKQDCKKCDACKDKPCYGGKGLRKQACFQRVCLWKNPSGRNPHQPKTPGKRGRKRLVDSPKQQLTPPKEPNTKRGRLSLPVIAPIKPDKKTSETPESEVSAAADDKPDSSEENGVTNFKPGSLPSIVKKGDEEYVVIVSGVKDTGLCGKYWSDMNNLPSRRRSRAAGNNEEGSSTPKQAKKEASTPATAKKATAKALAKDDTKGTPVTKRRGQRGASLVSSKEDESTTTVLSKNSTVSEPSPTKPMAEVEATKLVEEPGQQEELEEPGQQKELEDPGQQKELEEPGHQKELEEPTESEIATTEPVSRSKRSTRKTKTPDKNNQDPKTIVNNRSVSCVADTSTQREVVVECFAPYDDHKWVDIGKERDNMAPDAVQYARALRPPYHLLSFLRIKGHSTKGMSCTDKNTMVFVVLEGEITVVLHTTQFNAKKGDSFYIPPKNYYNLINQKAREAELSLIQFQYDGPLPTVAANSQSGSNKSSTTTVPKQS